MEKTLKTLLPEDYAQIKESLTKFDAYNFAEELDRRMLERNLSSVELGRCCNVSHTAVDKWRTGEAKPNGRERFKKLGMALGYNVEELNSFLLKNGYPALYIKNPMDGAVKMLLADQSGKWDTVRLYEELVERLNLSEMTVCQDGAALSSRVMSKEFHQAMQTSHASIWFKKNEKNFVCDARTQLSSLKLSEFVMLYLTEENINEMVKTHELPVTIRNLLYPVLGNRSIPIRHLREKLIAFGLYSNMTEEEINIMLECMKLRSFSEPETKTDMAVLCAVRNAHERYPYFEYENVKRAAGRLKTIAPSTDIPVGYEGREVLLARLISYYDRAQKAADDITFEKYYTSFSDRGIMDYVHDMLLALLGENLIEPLEAVPFIGLLERDSQE